jgi:hypothetical protein
MLSPELPSVAVAVFTTEFPAAMASSSGGLPRGENQLTRLWSHRVSTMKAIKIINLSESWT